jgi:isopentenyl-diphosphate delta-isomerase
LSQGDQPVTLDPGGMETRKRRHIDVCLSEAVDYQTVTTGLERYRLPYNALTQTDLGSVDLTADFLGARLRAPVLIGSMTGGAELSGTINRNLAAAAQQLGVGMMLGSQRIMFDNESASTSFSVRDVAPDVLLIGNIGLAQLNQLVVPDLVKALDHVGANAPLLCIPIRCRRRCSTRVTPISPAPSRGCATSQGRSTTR